MDKEFNQHNINADKLIFGQWSSSGDYFSRTDTVDELYSMFSGSKPALPKKIELIDFAAADGLVGEHIQKLLNKDGYETSLTILDIIPENLAANENPSTKKIQADLLDFETKDKYDLGVARSVLHYFAPEDQVTVLENIRKVLCPDGTLVLQVYMHGEKSLPLFKALNTYVGKQFQIVDTEFITKSLQKAGFSEIECLGTLPIHHYHSDRFKWRYNLSIENISEMRKIIDEAPEEERKEYILEDDGKFQIPMPYKVFVAKNKSI